MKAGGHISTLDGLRGVAAFSIVVFHLFQAPGQTPPLPKAYLAVDFFFILSGFVIAKAYEAKLAQTMGFFDFVKIRAVRLYPLVVLIMLIGFFIAVTHHSADGPRVFIKLFGELVFGALLLPYRLVGPGATFPLDAPVWSLFCELVINFIYAGIVVHLRKRFLVLIIVTSLGLLIFISSSNVVAGVNHGVNTGAFCDEVFYGLVRCSFSFNLGVLLYRLNEQKYFTRVPAVSGVWLAVILLLSFCPAPASLPWVYDIVCVTLLYPGVIIAGSRCHLPAILTPMAFSLGALSYPVYVLHWPFLGYVNRLALIWGRGSADLLSIVVLTIVSWIVLIYFDGPCRNFLTRKFCRGETRPPTAPICWAGNDAIMEFGLRMSSA